MPNQAPKKTSERAPTLAHVPALAQQMPAQNTHESIPGHILAVLRFLAAIVIITALHSTYSIQHTLNPHAEQRKREFCSIIIIIVCATLAIADCIITSHHPPQACQNKPKQAQNAPI
jgi:hypothetical protein